MYGRPLKLSLNIHPGAYDITPEEVNYALFAQAMGADPSTGEAFGCNLYNKTYALALMDTMLDPTGMDYVWDDCYACTWKVGGHTGADGGSCGDSLATNVEANLWSNHGASPRSSTRSDR